MRNIKNDAGFSKSEQNGIIALYEALVPRHIIKSMNVAKIREYFPTFEDIDIAMIAQEAFPVFEKTIGVDNFKKVKKYFGIGCKNICLFNNKKRIQEVEALLTKLRTIDNAQFYISGYKELITKVACKLEGGHENLTDLVKAKLVRMYYLLYADYHYFSEDYVYDSINKKLRIDYSKVFVNNKYEILPEELFVIYITKLSNIMDENIFYDFIHDETINLEKRTLKEVLRISELEYQNGNFLSINDKNSDWTFGMIRNLKIKIHPEPEEYPMDLFAVKQHVKKIEVYDLYFMYKLLKVLDLNEFEKVERKYNDIDGSRVTENSYTAYQLPNKAYISGEREKERIINFVEYLAYRGFSVYSAYWIIEDDKTDYNVAEMFEYNAQKIFGAIMLANEAGYLSGNSAIEDDFKVALKFSEIDKDDTLEAFYQGNITVEEAKSRLGIDEEFELKFFGIEKKIDLNQVISKFAIDNGYVSSEQEIDEPLVQSAIISGNEEIIERYGKGEISAKQFAEKIGFTPEYAPMFFNLSKIDVEMIETKLLEIKKTTSSGQKIKHRYKCLIMLYCYIIENEIKCGPKMRVPKRNKALKPANLRMFVS